MVDIGTRREQEFHDRLPSTLNRTLKSRAAVSLNRPVNLVQKCIA